MLRRMGTFTALLVIVVLSLSQAQGVRAEMPPAGRRLPLAAGDEVRLLSSTAAGVAFRLDVPWQGLNLEPAYTAGQQYTRVSLPGWSNAGEAGSPALPALARAAGVPFGARLSVRVEPGPAHLFTLPAPVLPIATAEVELEPAMPAASGPALSTPDYTTKPDPAIYSASAPYPRVLARVASDGVVRQQRVAGIVAYPVQYRPASRELAVYEWLGIYLTFDGALASAGETKQGAPESGAYEEFFRHQLLNYEVARQWRRPVSGTSPSFSLPGDMQAEAWAAARSDLESLSGEGGWATPVPGWRVKVRADGMYRLTHVELEDAGLPVDALDPRTLQVYYRGREVAILVSGETDGRLDPEDDLLFYGQALSSKYTAGNVYWLAYGHQAGLRMAARDGSPGDGAPPAYYRASRHLEANLIYRTRNPGDETLDRWLWDYIYPPGKPGWSATFTLVAPYQGAYVAKLKLAMLGALDEEIDPDHHTRVYVNGMAVEDANWDGQAWRIAEIEFPQSYLRTGDNTISVVCPNDTGAGVDLVYIDWAELEFANTFRAEGDALAFGAEAAGTQQYQVDGFTTGQVAAYDITDPAAVARIEGVRVTPSGPAYSAQFQDTASTPAQYWVGAPGAYQSVQAIEAGTASDLRSAGNGADYIIVTHEAFADQAATLAGFRAQRGLRARVVDVQDVYDEFAWGVVDPVAIHDFLAYAYHNWQAPAPSYVVLLGDGHYDPKNYLGAGPAGVRISYVPPYLAPVDPWINETAADNRYVTVAGQDPFPDMMLGRLPANSSAEASALVNKIIAYEKNPPPGAWRQQVLAAADDADSAGDFAAMSENLLEQHLPASFQAAKVYLGVTHSSASSARSAIQAAIDAGKLIVNYAGHAAVTAWAAEGLFKASDVPSLQNGSKLPVILAMTCYDGYFHYPYPYSEGTEATGEVVTRADGRGAVASWSPAGLGVATGHELLAKGFLDAVFQDGVRTLGAATTAGKLALWATGSNLDLMDTYLLFGDPATQLPVGPEAAPVAPEIGVQPVPDTGYARLTWLNRTEDPYYEVWRGTTPYFDPGQGEGNLIALLSGEPYGSMAEVPYTDDGIDRHFSLPNDPQSPPVAVMGDASTNYFWVVRGRNDAAVSGNSNRVGEFDFALVR